MSRAIDITGLRFGRLVAVARADRPHREWRWRLQCDCGGETTTTVSKVRSGYTSSCGCVRREETSRAKYKHGESNAGGARPMSRVYSIWRAMIGRCENVGAVNYERYGARGISVCEEWRKSFVAFRDWALANGYRDDLTIERRDNDGNYHPSNCTWATYKEQAMNRRPRKRKSS